ncbi:hypothetical protein TCSYLVIO_002860 [Trypanosoma cruzi]|nr:hypothetical protein TCSYLVIO_002860 [Trypanosoma cruzi]
MRVCFLYPATLWTRFQRISSNFLFLLLFLPLQLSLLVGFSLVVQARREKMVCPAPPRQVVVVDPAWVRVDEENYNAAWKQLREEAMECGFIGFDMEWTSRPKPVFEEGEETTVENRNAGTAPDTRDRVRVRCAHSVEPVAVVQLSTFSVTFVIRLCDIVYMARPENCIDVSEAAAVSSTLGVVLNNLTSLLANKRVAKVGVGIIGDQEKLQREYTTFRLCPCVELAVLARHLFPTAEDVMGLRSLKDFAARFAGRNLKKDILVICSDWGSSLGALSPLQLEYAAADAEASFDVCLGMCRESHLIASDNIDDNDESHGISGARDAKCNVNSILQSLDGLKATTFRNARVEKPAGNRCASWWCKGRAKPYYDNIFVYDAEMRLVFTVDKSKAEWYVYKKGLGKVIEWRETAVEETQKTEKEIAAIQLNFSPDLSKYNDAHIRRNLDYFRQAKENQCVVCGEKKDLVRFAVVPLAYRKYFPSVYMSHNSYDLLLLCTVCFARARRLYDEERRRVAVDFGVPLGHLTPKELELHRAQLQQQMSTNISNDGSAVDNIARSRSNSSSSRSNNNTATSDRKYLLSPAQKTRIMQEYLEIEKHREVLLKIFKYAKALRVAYEETTVAAGCIEEDKGVNQTAAVNEKPAKPSVMPPGRARQLAAYMRLHAQRYPFAKCASERMALFTADAASKESVRCILEEGISPRVVLTRFWLREHPKLREMFSCTTRRSERHEDGGSPGPQENGERLEENLFVDSHGFLIVQALLEKYDTDACKCRDHAIGEFIYRWRTAFLQGMRPRHLPSGWSAEDGILL